MSHAVYLLVRAIASVLSRLPSPWLYALLRCVGRWFWRLHRPIRRRVLDNLRIAFGPELDDRARERIGRLASENLLQLFGDILKIPRLVTHENAQSYFDFVDFDMVERLSDRRTGVLFLTGHVGSFEAAGHAWGLAGYPLNSVSRPMKNLPLYQWLTRLRRSTGQGFIPRKGALRQVLRHLKEGKHVAFLFDQNQRKENVFVPFFSRLAATTPAPALFALRMNAPMIFGYARRVGGTFRFEAKCCAVIEPPSEGTEDERIRAMMTRANQELEKVIRERPEEYFWFHDRWRTRPPEEKAPERAP